MPYFKWRGVDIGAVYRSGKVFASSHAALDALLIKQEIALITAKPTIIPPLAYRITQADLLHLFSQLAILLKSGIFLADALLILAEQLSNPRMQELVCALADEVHKGTSLSVACAHYPHLFTPLMIQTIHVGQETGSLAVALEQLCDQATVLDNFSKELRSAALIPGITLGFFFCIAAIIIFGIMPRFIQLIRIKDQDVPAITRFLIRLSEGTDMVHLIMAGVLFALTVLVFRLCYKTAQGRAFVDTTLVHLPLIAPIIIKSYGIYYIRSLALLTRSGMTVVPAMRIAAYTITNVYLHESVIRMGNAVESGNSLSQAMVHERLLFGPDIQALVAVGEKSARLSELLYSAADSYQRQVKQRLTFCTQVFQPLLLLVLGMLIAGLIAATYIPIITMSGSIGF